MEKLVLALALFIAAWALLAVEVLVIPGFGVGGVIGIGLLVGAIAFTWASFGTAWGVGTTILSLLLFAAALWAVAKTRVGRRFVLGAAQEGVSSHGYDNAGLVGKEGVLLSDLRPVGTALVEGRRIEVISKGVFLEKGCRVRVVEASGPSVVVEQADG